MREVYYPGDYVKFSFCGDVDYGTVVRMGTLSDPNNPDLVLVVWDSDDSTLHVRLDFVSLVLRAEEREALF